MHSKLEELCKKCKEDMEQRSVRKGNTSKKCFRANASLCYECLATLEIELTYQLKDASVSEANPTPPTIGTSESRTQRVGICTTKQPNDLYL